MKPEISCAVRRSFLAVSSWWRASAWVAGTWLALAVVLAVAGGCRRPPEAARPASVAAAVAQTSMSCGECHREQLAAWQPSDHAQANRPVEPAQDGAALAGLAAHDAAAKPEFILGHRPLWQPLIPAGGGRWQPHEWAVDPQKREWFNVLGDGRRRAGEWGHWMGQGMNWNSMCAHCHMTGFQRRYDVAADSYASMWVEHGVGCIQCHGPIAPGHGDRPKAAAPAPRPPFFGDRAQMMETCAPCHARNERLTERFQPGDSYHDHYRAVPPVDAAVFFPDGQQRDEVFNWTSVLLSRMGHAGVTCLDCHEPHSGRTTLPTSDNQLCLQCHAAPGRKMPGGAIAVPIDPAAHSRHAPGSAGHSCIACHMSVTNYLVRAPRHDHGWLSPDPLLTKELGIPNACSRCHEDKGLEWAIAKVAEDFGTRVLARQRARARAVAAAQADAPGAAAGLLELLAQEDIPAWRATYLALLSQTRGGAAEREAAISSLRATHPLERAAAVRYLAHAPDAETLVAPLLQDPVRLVRLDAAWVISTRLPVGAPARREFDEYLALELDQPTGRLRAGQDKANRGDLAGAVQDLALAVQWDPFSPALREAYGLVLAASGRTAEAGTMLYRAAELAGARGGPSAFRAGLAFAEAHRPAEAENAFRLAVRCDPALDRAWYNLGLLLANQERLGESAEALRRAEAAAPASADYPYALATVLLRAGDRDGARAAVQRALRIDSAHAGARQVERALGR